MKLQRGRIAEGGVEGRTRKGRGGEISAEKGKTGFGTGRGG